MKNEFSKVLSSIIIYVLTFILIILISLIGLNYNQKSKDIDNFMIEISKYETKDDLKEMIEEYEVKVIELEIGNAKKDEIETAKYYLKLYRFILDNDISYESTGMSTNLNSNSKDKISFVNYIMPFLIFFIFIYSVIISIFVISYEQDIAISKLIYAGKTSRVPIILKKFIVFMVIYCTIIMMFVFLLWFLSNIYDMKISNVIINSRYEFRMISANTYLLNTYLSYIYIALFYGLLFFTFSLYFNKIIYMVILSLGYIFLEFLFLIINNDYIVAATSPPMTSFNIGVDSHVILIFSVTKIFLVIIALIYSIYRFNNKDIL